jgi:hypothetical protein
LETAGALPTQPGPRAERDWPRMDPPNVLWFFGAFAISFATIAVIAKVPASHRGVWELLVALAFYLAYALVGFVLLRLDWWIPGGLLMAVAVSLMPAVGVGVGLLVGTFPHGGAPFDHASWTVIIIGLVTMLDALVSYAITRFAFIFFTFVLATLITAQFFLPVTGSHPSTDARLATAIITGGLLVVVGLALDMRGRRRDAFWFHAGGFFGVAIALIYWSTGFGGHGDRGWISMFVAATFVLLVSPLLRRATWATYGVLGFYAPLVHWLTNGLSPSSTGYLLILLAIGLGIFALGMAVHRYGRIWSRGPSFPAEPRQTSETL